LIYEYPEARGANLGYARPSKRYEKRMHEEMFLSCSPRAKGRDFINERARRAKTSSLEGGKEAGFALARFGVSLYLGMDMIDR